MFVSTLRLLLGKCNRRNRIAARRVSAARRLMRVESLQRREVCAVDLQAVFGLGNDSASTSVAAITTDSAGNQYVAGTFGGTVDLIVVGRRLAIRTS